MSRTAAACLLLVLSLLVVANAATKPHAVSLGKPTVIKWFVGLDESATVDVRIRPIYVDTRLKEFTLGPGHDITDRLFVIQRMFRLNDALPQDKVTAPQWRWQRGGWLQVDRTSGRISSLTLPLFDPYYSAASWYRDYIAYCGVSEDGKKVYAVVAQLGRRKPILKQLLGDLAQNGMPDSACAAPLWQRPGKVSFEAKDQKFTYSIRGHSVDLVNDNEDEEGSE